MSTKSTEKGFFIRTLADTRVNVNKKYRKKGCFFIQTLAVIVNKKYRKKVGSSFEPWQTQGSSSTKSTEKRFFIETLAVIVTKKYRKRLILHSNPGSQRGACLQEAQKKGASLKPLQTQGSSSTRSTEKGLVLH